MQRATRTAVWKSQVRWTAANIPTRRPPRKLASSGGILGRAVGRWRSSPTPNREWQAGRSEGTALQQHRASWLGETGEASVCSAARLLQSPAGAEHETTSICNSLRHCKGQNLNTGEELAAQLFLRQESFYLLLHSSHASAALHDPSANALQLWPHL